MEAQKSPSHHLEILKIVAQADGVDPTVRQAAAVRFKNVIAKGWDTDREDGTDGIVVLPADRTTLKAHLVQLMCTTPARIQAQLSESISLIAAKDYPQQWENLLPELIKQLQTTDTSILHGVLKTMESIFNRFRYVERSDDLYRVLKYTLDGCQSPLLALYQNVGQAVDGATNDVAQLKAHFESLSLITKIFYSLNYQDLPEFFEDNIGAVMQQFRKYLEYKNVMLVDADEEDEPGLIEKLQVDIITILHLYADKDEECFLPFLPVFSAGVWNLITAASSLPKDDLLVTTSIKFIGSLVSKEMHRTLFQDDATLRQIVQKIVVPNLMFRESDEEKFEDDPREFIVTEVEGSDSESRRRCSQDLLKDMCRRFPDETSTICGEYITSMLTEFTSDPSNKWAAKDAAIHLMVGISVKLESPATGVTEVTNGESLLNFFQQQILPELQDANHTQRPVVKATSLKFVSTFRNQFSKEHLVQLIPMVIQHLSSPVVVVHTFAAYTLERIMITKENAKDNTSAFKIRGPDLREFLNPMFTGLFSIVDSANAENDYVMKCVMRSLATADSDVVPVTQLVIEKLTSVLIRVAKNPTNPAFNHYVFESIAVLVRNVCTVDQDSSAGFEPLLFKPFTDILQQDVTEFTPYVFQILAQLLEFRRKGTGLGQAYTDLFPPLLKPAIWENKGNSPALARLLQAYISKAPAEISSQLTPILGVCQKLLASKASEISAFTILNATINNMPTETMTPVLKQLLQVLLQRLQAGKTPRYVALVTTFFALLVGKYGVETVVGCFDAIQPGLFVMLMGQVWNPFLTSSPKLDSMEAKKQLVGLTRLLCEYPALLADQQVWSTAFAGALFIASTTTFSDTNRLDKLDRGGETEIAYDSVFSRLVFASKPAEDAFRDIGNPAQVFAQSIHGLASRQNSLVLPMILAGVGEDEKQKARLDRVFTSAGFHLSA